MGISRAAYYKWTHRKVTAHEQENQAIRDYIIELEEQNQGLEFGVLESISIPKVLGPF